MPRTAAAALAAIVVSAAAVTAWAQTPTVSTTPTPAQDQSGGLHRANAEKSTLASSDRRFVAKAAELGTEEVAVSRVVARAATDPRVRAFATEMVSAHQKVDQELADLAAHRGLMLPPQNENVSRWTREDPKSLGADYVSQMESAHEKMINLFEKAARSDDADVATLAEKTLPDLRRHYTMARELKKSLHG